MNANGKVFFFFSPSFPLFFVFLPSSLSSKILRVKIGCRGTIGAKKGKFYYEVEITDDGLGRVGWSSKVIFLIFLFLFFVAILMFRTKGGDS